jgi:hypothetical protein
MQIVAFILGEIRHPFASVARLLRVCFTPPHLTRLSACRNDIDSPLRVISMAAIVTSKHFDAIESLAQANTAMMVIWRTQQTRAVMYVSAR